MATNSPCDLDTKVAALIKKYGNPLETLFAIAKDDTMSPQLRKDAATEALKYVYPQKKNADEIKITEIPKLILEVSTSAQQ